MNRQTTKILDVKFDAITLDAAEARLEEMLATSSKSIIATPNTEFVIQAQTDSEFREILNNKAKLNLPDSIGILWAASFLGWNFPENKFTRNISVPIVWFFSLLFMPFLTRFFRKPLPEKISGSDFIWSVANIAAKNKSRLFLYGGAPTVAERTALKLQTDVPDLRVVGVHSGHYLRDRNEIIEAINRSRADILIVCLGAPKQEKWLAENLAKTDCKVGIGLGGTFDYISQNIPRAPHWMRHAGLEWLYRLFSEPKRLKRQFALPKFAWLVLKEKLKTD